MFNAPAQIDRPVAEPLDLHAGQVFPADGAGVDRLPVHEIAAVGDVSAGEIGYGGDRAGEQLQQGICAACRLIVQLLPGQKHDLVIADTESGADVADGCSAGQDAAVQQHAAAKPAVRHEGLAVFKAAAPAEEILLLHDLPGELSHQLYVPGFPHVFQRQGRRQEQHQFDALQSLSGKLRRCRHGVQAQPLGQQDVEVFVFGRRRNQVDAERLVSSPKPLQHTPASPHPDVPVGTKLFDEKFCIRIVQIGRWLYCHGMPPQKDADHRVIVLLLYRICGDVSRKSAGLADFCVG